MLNDGKYTRHHDVEMGSTTRTPFNVTYSASYQTSSVKTQQHKKKLIEVTGGLAKVQIHVTQRLESLSPVFGYIPIRKRVYMCN